MLVVVVVAAAAVVEPDELEKQCWKSCGLICICILFDDLYSCDTICFINRVRP